MSQTPRRVRPRQIDLVLLPRDLRPAHLSDRAVVVFDVLRATTTVAAALAAGVAEIRIFGDVESARAAARRHPGPRVLCGEQRCLPPPGFDLGNSPGGFVADRHRGLTAFMSTTNGTRAILAARAAPVILTGALVNASVVARALASTDRDVTLLCAGTDGQVAPEDVIGAGAVLDALSRIEPNLQATTSAEVARDAFAAARHDLTRALQDAQGGRNVIAAGLPADVAYAARLDVLDVVGAVRTDDPLRVVAHPALV